MCGGAFVGVNERPWEVLFARNNAHADLRDLWAYLLLMLGTLVKFDNILFELILHKNSVDIKVIAN